jgi:hypothetical protein
LAGRIPAEAVGAFLAPLQQAIDCLTPAVLNVSGGYHVAERPHALTLGNGDPVPLTGRDALSLSVMQQYLLAESEGARGPWKVHTTAYLYELQLHDAELLVYHWHPSGVSPQTRPHLHIGPAAELGFKPLQGRPRCDRPRCTRGDAADGHRRVRRSAEAQGLGAGA